LSTPSAQTRTPTGTGTGASNPNPLPDAPRFAGGIFVNRGRGGLAVSKQCNGSPLDIALSDGLAVHLLKFSLIFSKYLICHKNFLGPLSRKNLVWHKKNLGPERAQKFIQKFLSFITLLCRDWQKDCIYQVLVVDELLLFLNLLFF